MVRPHADQMRLHPLRSRRDWCRRLRLNRAGFPCEREGTSERTHTPPQPSSGTGRTRTQMRLHPLRSRRDWRRRRRLNRDGNPSEREKSYSSSSSLNLWLFIHRTGQVQMTLFVIAQDVISCPVEELIQLHKVVSIVFLLLFNYDQALFCLKIGFDNFFINWIKIKRDSMSKSGNSCRDLHLFAIRICPFGGS